MNDFERPVSYERRETIPEVYSGVPTFLGVPRITSGEIDGQDVVIVGAPWEGILHCAPLSRHARGKDPNGSFL